MCLLGYTLIFAWWAHIALSAEWQRGGRRRRFLNVSAIQISSAYGKRTKKDVPFGIHIIICLVGTYRPQGGMAECRPVTQVLHRERHTNIIRLR
jgi:hypothetical protein